MDQGEVTLLAALIAALASIISLLGDIFSTWSGELRATHRNALLPYLAELGSSIDLFVSACIKYGQQIESGVVNPAGLQEALDTVEKLNEVRAKVKYPLWGIDIGIETLSMLPFWLKDWGHDPYSQKRLIRDAVRLRTLLDEIIRRSYQVGHPPTTLQVWHVKIHTRRFKNVWGHAKTKTSFGSTS